MSEIVYKLNKLKAQSSNVRFTVLNISREPKSIFDSKNFQAQKDG